MKNLIIIASIALSLSACAFAGRGGNSGGNGLSQLTNAESYSYDFSYNGCKTGRHEFSSNEDLCRGLENDRLNNFCATDMRADEFEKKCPGQTFTPF